MAAASVSSSAVQLSAEPSGCGLVLKLLNMYVASNGRLISLLGIQNLQEIHNRRTSFSSHAQFMLIT